jgi:hydrogenase maturation protein HypF
VVLKGVVQGVGFRPWVYRVARQHNLKGWVLNSRAGLIAHLEGGKGEVDLFVDEVKKNPPPLSKIDSIVVETAELVGYTDFTIRESEEDVDKVTLISPDVAVCPDCSNEIFDTNDRRFEYPFTNCTNCGPRMSIIVDTPYDRRRTSMRRFELCPQCRREYEDPSDRRFHAQPNACSTCGPSVGLLDSEGVIVPSEDPIKEVAVLLGEGEVVAVKGIGGYHIAVDARNSRAVSKLRSAKCRPHKPFAVMIKNEKAVRKYCHLTPLEERWLKSPAAPILLLRKKKDTPIASECAPGNPYLGVMLPYTPLHALIFSGGSPDALVMTSGNRRDEPLVATEEEATERLSGIVDYFLTHNREIVTRNDDSVGIVLQGDLRLTRRSRGFAPHPIQLPAKVRPTLAYGAELKNTFCLAEGRQAFISPHVGDLFNLETSVFLQELIEKFSRWFRVEPEIVAYDLHPGYLSTKLARQVRGCRLVGVQHHFAHVTSCMAENELKSPVIGIAFDGTGYGTDGKIWGCEFMIADYGHFEREAHLAYLPLPGGDAAIKKPYRTAVAYLSSLLGDEEAELLSGRVDPEEFSAIQHQVKKGISTAYTSSCGRLFDAVASILGICDVITFEAQAAIALEFIADGRLGEPYGYEVKEEEGMLIIDPRRVIEGVVRDCKRGKSAREVSRRFHASVVEFAVEISGILREAEKIERVVLSGGVFQNALLLRELSRRLRESGFDVYTHSKIPTNDGGISLGQVMAANS